MNEVAVNTRNTKMYKNENNNEPGVESTFKTELSNSRYCIVTAVLFYLLITCCTSIIQII